MTRITFLTVSMLLVAPLLWGTAALADERPPCSDEADVVRKMQTRDPSLAYPKNAKAKEHLEAAKRAFGVQQYDKAVSEYMAAGLADDAPLILYNLGQTYREAKDYTKAIRQYELFLERGQPGPEVRALVKCHITRMKAELEHAASTAPPSGPASDPTSTQSTAAPASGGGGVEAATTTPEVDETPRDTSRWTTKRKIAIGFALGGVIGIGAGTVFALQNRGYKDDAARLCPSDPCANADEANALSDRASTRATLANVSFGVGAGLVAGAVVLWFVGAPSTTNDRADESAFVPHITSSFAGAVYSGRF
jgi:tetratricopeptide (TPR) repeat protein